MHLWARKTIECAVLRTAAVAVLALLAAPLLGSCTVQGAASTLYHNRNALRAAAERPLLVHEARNLYLLRSGDVFYPEGQVTNPAELPPLSDKAIALIGSIMEVELQHIRGAQTAHAAMLAREFPGHNPLRVSLRLVPTDYGTASGTSIPTTGDVVIDVRIIQATYRAALISVFSADSGLNSTVDTLTYQENQAFYAFSDYRARLRNLRSFTLQDDLTGARLGLSVLGNESDQQHAFTEANQLFNRLLEESSTMIESQRLERAFMGAVRFVLAHEAAHVALNHPSTPATCEEALINEAAADKYAVLVSALADYARIPGMVIAQGSTRYSMTFLTPIERLVVDPSDGSSQFFGFAYSLAGLDSRLNAAFECSYPEPKQRLAAIRPLANVIHTVHSRATMDQSLRRFGARSARRELGATPFDTFFLYLAETATAEAETTTAEEPYPADLTPLRDMLSEVYYDTYRRDN